MVMTAEEKKAKRKLAYQKKKTKLASAKKIATLVKDYMLIQKAKKAKAKPKKTRKPPTKEVRKAIKASMEAYHMCCKSANCGKKYKK